MAFSVLGAWLLASGSMDAEHCTAWPHGFEDIHGVSGK